MSWYFFKDKNIKTGNAKVDLTVKTTKYTCTTMHTINISDASNMMVTSYYLSFQIVTFRWNLNTFFNVTGHQRFPQTSANISTRVTLKSIHLIKKTKQEIYLKFCTQNQNSFSFLICPLVPFFFAKSMLQNLTKMHKNTWRNQSQSKKFYPKEKILMRKNNVLLFVSFGIMTPIYLHEWEAPTFYRSGRRVSYDLGHSRNMFSK